MPSGLHPDWGFEPESRKGQLGLESVLGSLVTGLSGTAPLASERWELSSVVRSYCFSMWMGRDLLQGSQFCCHLARGGF